MQVIHLLCPPDRAFPLAQELEAQSESQPLEAQYTVAASGPVYLQPVSFVVLTTPTCFDDELLHTLDEHPDVHGYSRFSLADDEVFPFGCELVNAE